MTLEVFVLALLIVSTVTSLVTEAVKKVMEEFHLQYFANTLAGICAIIVASLVGFGYIMYMSIQITMPVLVLLIALILLSWLCAMVGYDKVVQALAQIKNGKEK